MVKFLLLMFLVHQSSAVIYDLNFTEFSKMPELFTMDEYNTCVDEPGGTYCVFDAVLYSKSESELMRTIQEYSAVKVKHFNHTIAHRAFCVQRTCKQFMQNRSLENEEDLKAILEECIDDSMWKSHKLNARLKTIQYCKKHGEKRSFDAGDYIMAGVYLILIILNAVGTTYDMIVGKGNPYLLAFSLPRNWRKLIAPSGVGPEPRLNTLQCFNGMRAMTMVCVYFSHTALVLVVSYMENPYYVERAYDEPAKYILFNGTLVTMTFFVMSGFLLAFNFELHAEKHRVSLWEWPKGMLMRWLRLTPTYALVIFTVMTINRHLGDGPLWDLLVTSETKACYQYWWAHLLYINNYIYDDSHCFPQSWYLAADTQLFALGLLVCILARKPKTQILVLGIMMVISLVIPAAYVIFGGLDAVVLQSPETHRSIFRFDDTFRYIFIPAHTNLSTYTLGIAGGLLSYHWLKNEKSVSERLQKYRWIMWLAFPAGVGIILSGGIFYMDNFEPSTFVKAMYAAFSKPIFQINVLIIMIGCVFKVERLYRGILEWRGLTWLARASFGGFLLHSLFQRGVIGIQTQRAFMSDFTVITFLASTIFLAFASGALLFVTVESPMAVVVKTLLAPPKRKREEKQTDKDTTVTQADTKDDVTKV